MANAERRPAFVERIATATRNAGIVAGIIGLVINQHIAALGFFAALGSEMLE